MGDETPPQAPAAPAPTPAPVAPAAPEIPLAGGEKMLEAAAGTAGLTPAELATAQERLAKMHEGRRTEYFTATRESLAGLAAQVRQDRPADSADFEKVNSVLLTVERELALAAFKEKLVGDKVGFAVKEEGLKNSQFIEVCKILQEEIFALTNPSFPVEQQSKWMKLVADSFAEKINAKDSWFDVTSQEIKVAKKEVIEEILPFEEWFKKQPEYTSWKESVEAARKAKEDEAKKKTDAEAAAKTAAETAEREAVAKAEAAALIPPPVPPESPEEMAPADKMKALVDGMEDGKLKTSLGMALGALSALFVKLAEIPLIGDWFRGNFISNKMLAEQLKDKPDKQELYEKARQTAALEDEFARFGLPRELARKSAGKKTKDVISTFEQKPTDVTTDTALQEKVKYFAGELKRKNGTASEATLMAFINAPTWRAGGVKYSAAPAVAAGATPGAAPATPGAAPATTPETPAETAFNTAIDTAFSAHYGQSIDLASAPFSFTLPYTEGDQVKTAQCSIHGNEVTVDRKKYTMALPREAQLKSIKITSKTDAVLTASVKITDPLFGISTRINHDAPVPLKNLLKTLGKLQAGHQTIVDGIGDNQATFTKVT